MLIRRRPLVVAALLPMVLVGTGTALAADGQGTGVDSCRNQFVCVSANDSGRPGNSHGSWPAGGKTGRHTGGKAKPLQCTPPKKLDPQPPAASELWDGHDPADGGAVYVRKCRYFMADGSSTLITESVYGGSGGAPPAPAVDPAVLAQQAVDKMLLKGPRIGITPKPGGKGVVGMPVYMWTGKGAETYGPNTASATAGAVTVTATAKVSKIVWSMGDGKTVTCTTAGTPYSAEYGKNPSPDCGYRYTQPSSTQESGKYHVTATSTWTIDWAGGGQTGQLTEIRTSAVDIAVAEVQVLN
ncbi:ATP/GTP-binding protein [Streptomyces sp. NBC_01320]|uniref:ATP/GTP-binding protein n=1 Tax=Streptomyces sp. NBC_01320 TaxID=2903824 RepID=UPI002E16746F|nr:ATP/GTP-binding protein [Streptomyces sp. NBC_01320]